MKKYILLCGLLSLTWISSSLGNTIAFDISISGNDQYITSYILGYEFTVNTDIHVMELGFYDDQKNGLVEDHPVGIFSLDGDLLTSAVVSPSDYLDGYFRYTSIDPVLLESGQNYYAVAVNGSEKWTSWPELPSSTIIANEISFVADAFMESYDRPNCILCGPSYHEEGPFGYFGPNFKFATIPESSTIQLLSIGLVGIVGFARKKKFV